MTALVTALALLPLAITSGAAGNEIEGPMAVVILGGLITSTALNLIVLPTLALRYGRSSAMNLLSPPPAAAQSWSSDVHPCLVDVAQRTSLSRARRGVRRRLYGVVCGDRHLRSDRRRHVRRRRADRRRGGECLADTAASALC
jgi:hypothetical protein